MALSIIQENPVGVTLPVMFFARMLGQQLTLEDIKTDEPMLYRSLGYLLTAPEEELEDMPIEVDGVTHNVTLANRAALVSRAVNGLIPAAVQEHFNAIRGGFEEVIPLRLMNRIVDAEDFRTIVLGNPVISVEDLIANVQLRGFTHDSPQIRWLWNLLHTFSQDEMKNFLRFVTSSTQLPIGGFANLPRPLTIDVRNSAGLPTSSTCFYQLHLPMYTTEEDLHRSVRIAIESDAAMGNS
jgi:E3 ubiquitin-protein ligase HUWE1